MRPKNCSLYGTIIYVDFATQYLASGPMLAVVWFISVQEFRKMGRYHVVASVASYQEIWSINAQNYLLSLISASLMLRPSKVMDRFDLRKHIGSTSILHLTARKFGIIQTGKNGCFL